MKANLSGNPQRGQLPRQVTALTIILGSASLHSVVWASESLPTEAYEIVATMVATVVPEPLRPFFNANLATVREVAGTRVTGDSPAEMAVDANESHYVMLDVGAASGGLDDRRTAARRFPHQRSAARRLFKDHGMRSGGLLPWVIQDRYRALVRAFRDQDHDAIIRTVGSLVRGAADAALPFNTTADRDGEATGNLRWPTKDTAEVSRGHRTVRDRFHIGLIRRYRRQFEYEVRVWPSRFRHISEPAETTFQVLLDAHDCLPQLIAIDAELIAHLGITGPDSFLESSEAYYARLVTRAGPVIESRLEAGTLLAANLVGSAWTEAGSPSIAPSAKGDATSPAPVKATPAESEHSFVGSRNSTVFHRIECSHAKRIRPQNRVTFATVEDARAAGRVPCRTCQPGEP